MPQAFIEFYYDTATTITNLYDDAFKITALEDNCEVYYVKSSDNDPNNTLLYSVDWGQTWTAVNPDTIHRPVNSNTWIYGTTICTLDIGDSVLLRANTTGAYNNITYSVNSSFEGYNIWTSKKSSLSGHLWSLVTSQNYTTPTNTNVSSIFYNLFGYNVSYIYGSQRRVNKMADASKLKLPDFVNANMYQSMFRECTELVSAPELPATTLADRCYSEMFNGCTKLTNIPELPATTLANRCYNNMFNGCTEVKNAQSILPATTLADHCYNSMFYGCSKLVTAPNLPATTLAEGCYYNMFYGCTSLSFMPLLPATTLTENCYKNMFRGCSSIISSNSMYATTAASSSCESMFMGCTSLTVPPELHITTLANSCYKSMFQGCTALEKAPELIATSLVINCYNSMFNGCTHLSYIKTCAIGDFRSSTTYMSGWVLNVAQTGTFVKDPNATYDIDNINGVPIGWTVYDDDYGKYRLTIVIDPVGGGTVDGYPSTGGSKAYDQWSVVELNARRTTGYWFIGWYDSDGNKITRMQNHSFVITDDTTLTAKFSDQTAARYLIIELTTPNNEYGEVFGGGEYDDGVTVTLEANPAAGYHFLGWYDLDTNGHPLISTQNPYTFRADGWPGGITEHIEGRFEINPYTFSYTINNPSYGTVTGTPSGSYTYLEPISLAAQPNSTQYRFMGWFKGDTLVTRNLVYEFGLTEDTVLNARFYDMTEPSDLYELNYFTIESSVDNNSIRWYCSDDTAVMALGIFYSFDLLSWHGVVATTANDGTLIATINSGEKIYFKSVNSGYGYQSNNYHSFKSTGTVNISGNIMSLLYGDYFGLYETYTSSYTFKALFAGLNVINASHLVLPAKTLTPYCYYQMFYGCGSLVSAPELPFITAAQHSCDSMFWGCTSLITPPDLDSIYLESYCYSQMFYGCTALTSAPELPATTMYQGSYASMFAGCTSLTTAPELPATVLAPECYMGMFRTSHINFAPALPAANLEVSCYESMFENSAILTAPELNATTLAKYCYKNMFSTCTRLTRAPELPAKFLVQGCYSHMFYHCSVLNYIKALMEVDISEFPTYYTESWVDGVSSTGTFVKSSMISTSYLTRGINGIPENWSVQSYTDPNV